MKTRKHNIFLVITDIQNDSYNAVEVAKFMRSFDNWMRISDGIWFIPTTMEADELRIRVLMHCENADHVQVLVIALANIGMLSAGWISENQWNWIQKTFDEVKFKNSSKHTNVYNYLSSKLSNESTRSTLQSQLNKLDLDYTNATEKMNWLDYDLARNRYVEMYQAVQKSRWEQLYS